MGAEESNPYLPPKARVADAGDAKRVAEPRPRLVTIALWLMWADIALELLDIALETREMLKTVQTVVIASNSTIVMIFVVCALIFMTGRRHNWARIAIAILLAVGMSWQVTHWQELLDKPFRDSIQIAVQGGIHLAAMVLLFLPASNAWFRARK